MTTESSLKPLVLDVNAHWAVLERKIGVRYTLDDRAGKSNRKVWADIVFCSPEHDAPYMEGIRVPTRLIHLSTLCGGAWLVPPKFILKEYQGNDRGGHEFLRKILECWDIEVADGKKQYRIRSAQSEWLLAEQFVCMQLSGDSERRRLKATNRQLLPYHLWLLQHTNNYTELLKRAERYDGNQDRRATFQDMTKRFGGFVDEVTAAVSAMED